MWQKYKKLNLKKIKFPEDLSKALVPYKKVNRKRRWKINLEIIQDVKKSKILKERLNTIIDFIGKEVVNKEGHNEDRKN